MKKNALAIAVLLQALLWPAPAAAQMFGESPYIFGVHDSGGASLMGGKGWIVFSEAVGRDAGNRRGRDFRPWAEQGFGILVRLNHGYGPSDGTIPYQKDYGQFAQRIANYIQRSPGAHIWIIGNEMNLADEWPRYDTATEKITPERYAECFRQVRSAIKALAGHETDQVIPGAVAPNAGPVDGFGSVEYHMRILDLLGAGGLDGICLHAYTHGADPKLIFDEKLVGPRDRRRHLNFRSYRDFLNAHLSWARSLPVYITEADQTDPWVDVNSGWVKNAYQEIDDWNQVADHQRVRALCLYRFRGDEWSIQGKNGVIADFHEAMTNNYRWATGGGLRNEHPAGGAIPLVDCLLALAPVLTRRFRGASVTAN